MAAHKNHDRRTRSMRRRWVRLVLSATILTASSGCSILPGLQNSLDYSDECNEMMIDYRNQAWAAKAWHCRKNQFKNQCNLDDFGAGFRAGYMDTASGGPGCTPAFAPREYWSWKYQSPSGQQRVSAWFAGYPLGVKAAEEDGLGNYAFVAAGAQMQSQFHNNNWAGAAPAGTAAGQAPSGASVMGVPVEALAPAKLPKKEKSNGEEALLSDDPPAPVKPESAPAKPVEKSDPAAPAANPFKN
jgi:hypothetical protein